MKGSHEGHSAIGMGYPEGNRSFTKGLTQKIPDGISDQIEVAVENNLAAEQHGIKKTYYYQQQDANTEKLYYRFGVTTDDGVFSFLHIL